jgi:hypothetical protein
LLPIPFADDFLAGSLLSLLMPACLLITIAILFVIGARRVSTAGRSSAALPPSDVVASAGDAVDRVEPAGPPPGEIR